MADTLIKVCKPVSKGLADELAELADMLAGIKADIPDPTCPKIDRILAELKEPRRKADRLAAKGATDNEELADFAQEVDSCLWSLPDSLEELRNDNAQLRDGVHHLGSYCHEAAQLLRKAIAALRSPSIEAEIERLGGGAS